MNNTTKNGLILAASAGAGYGLAHLLKKRPSEEKVAEMRNKAQLVHDKSRQIWDKASDLVAPDGAEQQGQTGIMLAVLGGGLAVYGLRRRDAFGAAATTLGMTLMSKHPALRRVVRSPVVSHVIPALKVQ